MSFCVGCGMGRCCSTGRTPAGGGLGEVLPLRPSCCGTLGLALPFPTQFLCRSRTCPGELACPCWVAATPNPCQAGHGGPTWVLPGSNHPAAGGPSTYVKPFLSASYTSSRRLG